MDAAQVLADLRQRKTRDQLSDLPPDQRPADVGEAMAIQAQLRRMLASDLGAQVGWKIGCTTQVMQDYLSIRHPCAGTLYQATTGAGPMRLELKRFFRLGLECELATRLSADIPKGTYKAADLLPMLEGMMTSIEIVDERFKDFTKASPFSLIADDFFSWGCRLGSVVPFQDLPDPTGLRGGFRINNAAPESTGTGAAIMGHPLNALSWLAAEHDLEKGQIVTLGSVVKTIYPTTPCQIEARFEGMPSVRVEIV